MSRPITHHAAGNGALLRHLQRWLLAGLLAASWLQADEPDAAAEVPAVAPALPAAASDEAPPGDAGDNEPDLALAQFLDRMRHPPLSESWARMRGTVQHKADGQALIKAPIEVRALFSPRRTLAQLQFNDQERYSVAQTFSEGLKGTTVIREREAKTGEKTLSDLGIRPGDLTLSFLYWDFVEELPSQSLKTRRCRVLKLRNPAGDEEVVAWVTKSEAFPLRVSWCRVGETERYRELEFTGFEKQQDIWIVKRVQVYNRGWKTVLEFSDITLKAINAAAPAPADLFFKPE